MYKYQDIKNLIVLFIIHLISHFLPSERSSVGQDDFVYLLKENQLLRNFIDDPTRPLMKIWNEIQGYFLENYLFTNLYIVILSSFLTILFSYILLKILLKNSNLVFLVLVIYSLMINKLEIFMYLLW